MPTQGNIMKKDLISIFDLSNAEMWTLLKTALKLKNAKKRSAVIAGKSLGLIFEKPSTRTMVSFAVAINQLGGFPLILNPQNMQRGRGETIKDTARTLSRYLDAIVIRAFRHTDIEEFARWSSVPVINGLSDREHPCQVLGDILTIIEKKKIKTPDALRKVKVVFVGDGNNMANTWIGAAAALGFSFTLARPEGYGPDKTMLKKSLELAKVSGARIEITEDPQEAVKGADVIYTDVWTSMGEEAEVEKRRLVFRPYQVNTKLIAGAKKDCIVFHCLPAIRGEEITDEVMDSHDSSIFDQAENRLHIQKAVLAHLIK
jgi:ornithine carbamoyltransferase